MLAEERIAVRGCAIVDELLGDLEGTVVLSSLLGYLNFSDGRPDPRWQKQFHDVCALLVQRTVPRYWDVLTNLLGQRLHQLHREGSAAFRDIQQAERVLALLPRVLGAYREHHRHLLAHLSDDELFQPFFLVRVLETILSEGAEGTADEVVRRLNDFVGYRPIAILETRPRGEPYEHERHRPVPLYLRGVGVAVGRYQDLLERTLDLLGHTDPDILHAAHLDLQLLDEWALDVRAYDHAHPVNRRPNYIFGEWDPHHLDLQGRYRRFVGRHIILEALLHRVEQGTEGPRDELLFEAAAALAGTMLMATGICGSSPSAHDSSVSLATLMPGIARYRDAFYQQLLPRLQGAHAERLRQEQNLLRQPFGGVRQHLNQFLTRQRAFQQQQRYLALLFAEMGYPQASQQEARRIPAVSVRLLSEVVSRLRGAQREIDQGRLAEAAQTLPEVEQLLHEGIACGAFPDPWNILGFQALFPLSPAQEDSLRDPRLDELVQMIEQIFHVHARLTSEAAATGQTALVRTVRARMEKLATWWDRFATIEVSEVRRVLGTEAAESATHVASALGHWHERGAGGADLAFWRQHLDNFRSPKAFALVIDALLRKEDFRAALALLINWVGQVEQVPLEEGPYSFHALSLRWLFRVTGGTPQRQPDFALVQKFFDYLEANAEEYWQAPTLDVPEKPRKEEEDEEDLYRAAYEEVTYEDSTNQDEGALVEGGERQPPFDLEGESKRLEKRLRFLSALAHLWVVAARAVVSAVWGKVGEDNLAVRVPVQVWLGTARSRRVQLLVLLDAIHAQELPTPSGSYDSLVEYDRRRVIKEQLLYTAINTCLDMTLAVGALQGAQHGQAQHTGEALQLEQVPMADWETHAIRLEQALFQGDGDGARAALDDFLPPFKEEPLLFTPLADGGQPRRILRVRTAQKLLRALLANLPRLGLLKESFKLLRTARDMEQAHRLPGRGVTEFNDLFQVCYLESVESLVASAAGWGDSFPDSRLIELLERLTAPFLSVWIDHSRSVQLSHLESVTDETEWAQIRLFIQRYGRDLFHARFMTLGNLRGILHRGAGAYLDYLAENSDPLHPVKLIAELDRGIVRADAIRRLEFILHAVVENYEEYRDYNTTTSQSDYGENLHVLLDFLRLKVSYERHAWQFRPLILAHEVLARRGRREAVVLWEDSLTYYTGDLARQQLTRLQQLERERGVRLSTVSDRLNERFVKPLALDRLRALIEPAMNEARAGGATPSFVRLQEELQAYTVNPVGVGLDVPVWLRKLEEEVQRVLSSRSSLATMAEHFYRVPRRSLALEDLERQLQQW